MKGIICHLGDTNYFYFLGLLYYIIPNSSLTTDISGLNLIIKYQKITIPRYHMVKKTFIITNICNNFLTKKKRMINIEKNEDTNKFLMMLHFKNKAICFTLTNILGLIKNDESKEKSYENPES